MQSAKEKLENLSASPKAGMEKTEPTLQEKDSSFHFSCMLPPLLCGGISVGLMGSYLHLPPLTKSLMGLPPIYKQRTSPKKAEKLTTRDPLEKQMAEQKKEGRIAEAELCKQVAREQNYAEKEAARAGGLTTSVTTGHTTGVTTGHSDPLSSEYVESGTVGTRPIGTGTSTGTGTGRTTTTYNP